MLNVFCLSYSNLLLLFCVFIVLHFRVTSGAVGQLQQESTLTGGNVSLTCPQLGSGNVANWQFNDPKLASPTNLTANGKILKEYSSRFSLVDHSLRIKPVVSGDAGLYSCYEVAAVSGPTQYIFLRVSEPVRNTTDATPTEGTTASSRDWDKIAVIFYLVLLAIIFAIFIGVVIVLCLRAQKANFGFGKKSSYDVEQQRLQNAGSDPKAGPSTAPVKS